jgi:alpha-ribazole phosphatase
LRRRGAVEMSVQITRWWWVRHAPVPGLVGILYGQRDVPCDTSDKRSFEGLAKKIPEGAVWVTSNLGRTIETAAAIRHAGSPVPVDPGNPIAEPGFAEQSFGAWQHNSWNDLHDADSLEYKTFWQNPGCNAPPGGESFADLMARTAKTINRINSQFQGRDIVAVAHGGTIRAAVAHAMQTEPVMALAVTIDNLTLTRLDHISTGMFKGQGGDWRITGVNLPPI